MKKVISLILSMAMVLSLTVLSFAAGETYSITINNSAEGHTYEAYQIFTGKLSESGVLSNIQWGTGISEAGQTALQNEYGKNSASEIAEYLGQGTTQEKDTKAKAFAEKVAQYLNADAKKTSIVENNAYVIKNLNPGYYLIKDEDDSLKGDHDSYTSYLLKVVNNQTVAPKSANTTSQKKVKDTNDSTGETTNWQDSADYDIGDKVPFQLTGTVADNYDSYTKYQFIFHDQMSDGLTFDPNSVKVYIDGSNTPIEKKGNYDVVTPGTEDANKCTFEVVFSDLKQIESIHKGSVITVEYEAELNNRAIRGSLGNPNTSYLEYSNNPNDKQGGETGKTPNDTVIVFTYKTIINKKDDQGNPLGGAEFKLEKKIKGEDGSEDTWKTIDVVKSGDGKTFTFDGLDDGDYKLTETKAPDGYNDINPIEFKVTADHDIIIEDDEILNSLNGDKTTGQITFTSNTSDGSLTADVINKSGTTLPETGGIGTTIFYVVGAVLVIGAGVLFVTKRRMSTR